MDRRSFLQTAAMGLIIAPQIEYKKFEPFIRCDDDIRFKLVKNDWYNEIQISKLEFTSQICCVAGQDLIDTHGLCASSELATIIAQDIEYGEEGMKKLWSLPYSFNYDEREDRIRKFWLKKLKRIELTKRDKAIIKLFCHKMRGEHSCVRSNESIAKLDEMVKKYDSFLRIDDAT